MRQGQRRQLRQHPTANRRRLAGRIGGGIDDDLLDQRMLNPISVPTRRQIKPPRLPAAGAAPASRARARAPPAADPTCAGRRGRSGRPSALAALAEASAGGGIGGRRCEVGLGAGGLGVDRIRSRSAGRRSRSAATRCRPWWRSRPGASSATAAADAGAIRELVMSSLSLSARAESNREPASELPRRKPPRPRPRPDRFGQVGAAGPGGIMAGSRSASRSPPAARSPRFPCRSRRCSRWSS